MSSSKSSAIKPNSKEEVIRSAGKIKANKTIPAATTIEVLSNYIEEVKVDIIFLVLYYYLLNLSIKLIAIG